MPLPAPDPDEAMLDLQELAGYMRQHYVEAGDWWDNNGLPGLQDQALPDDLLADFKQMASADEGPRHERPRRRRPAPAGSPAGPDRRLITLPFRLFGVLAGSLVLCIAIECIGMHFFWPEQAGAMRRAC